MSDRNPTLARNEHTRKIYWMRRRSFLPSRVTPLPPCARWPKMQGMPWAAFITTFPSKEAIFQAVLMERHPYPRFRHLLTPANVDREHGQNPGGRTGAATRVFHFDAHRTCEFKGDTCLKFSRTSCAIFRPGAVARLAEHDDFLITLRVSCWQHDAAWCTADFPGYVY